MGPPPNGDTIPASLPIPTAATAPSGQRCKTNNSQHKAPAKACAPTAGPPRPNYRGRHVETQSCVRLTVQARRCCAAPCNWAIVHNCAVGAALYCQICTPRLWSSALHAQRTYICSARLGAGVWLLATAAHGFSAPRQSSSSSSSSCSRCQAGWRAAQPMDGLAKRWCGMPPCPRRRPLNALRQMITTQ